MSKVRNRSYKAKKILLALVLSMAMSTNMANADIVNEKNTPLPLHNKIYTLSRKFVKSKVKGAATGFAATSERQVIPEGNTTSFSNVTFDGAFIEDTNAYGGAIYNQGTISSITNAIFQNNYAKSDSGTALGGAIYNASTGTIGIKVGASDNNILFTNNWILNGATKKYNDIYNEGTITLNAATGKNITFDGAVTGPGTLVLNKAENGATGGEYHFNSELGGILEIYNGAIIRLGSKKQADGSTTYGFLNLDQFKPNDATVTLDLRNDHIDVHGFGDVTQKASVNHLLDVDIDARTADSFTAKRTTAVAGHILLGAFNLLSGSGDGQKIVNLSKNSFRFAMSLIPGFSIQDNITKAAGVTYNVKTVDYDYLSGNLIFNAEEFIPNGGTLDLVYKTSRDYLRLGKGNHETYSYEDGDIVKDRDNAHPYIVIINGQVYFFGPKEGTTSKNDAIIDLAATGSLAIKEVLPTDDYIFTKDGHYYSYSITFLPKSIWDNSPASSDDYNYYKTDGSEVKYYNVNLRTQHMNAIDTTVWTKSDSTTAGTYTWDPDTYIPLASEIKTNPETDTGGNLISASGMVRFNLPYNGTTTETRYYKYDYTVPADYTRQTSRITMSDNYITNLYFYNLSNNSIGSAIYNNTAANYNINADFIKNTTSKEGGAIYNDSSGKLGFISGTFINNTGSQGGVIFNNKFCTDIFCCCK